MSIHEDGARLVSGVSSLLLFPGAGGGYLAGALHPLAYEGLTLLALSLLVFALRPERARRPREAPRGAAPRVVSFGGRLQ